MKYLILCLLTILSLSAHAQSTKPPKVVLCTACHGEKGISPNPIWPNLAGQHSNYLIKLLKEFKKNKIPSAKTMPAIATGLSDQEIIDLSNYYSSQPIAQGKTPEKFLTRGQQIYRGGDFEQHITACIACHGPQGTGNAQAGFPSLSGQHAPYTILQLEAFQNKTRTTDLNHIMQDISKRMNKEDMEAVAYYLQGLY
jgi:cytochrome c553